MANGKTNKAGRRFSKTQKVLIYEHGLESQAIDNCVSMMLNTQRGNINSVDLFVDPNSSSYEPQDNCLKDLVRFEQSIHLNSFNAFELHSITKQNSLYFIMQYML